MENETLACGTGAVATAILAATRGLVSAPVDVHVRSGEILKIYFEGAGRMRATSTWKAKPGSSTRGR